MEILRNEQHASWKGPDKWFTGAVWADEIVTAAAPSRFKALTVSFEAGARTAWHTHPRGQALPVVSGLGRVQLQGQPPQEIRPGDTVWIQPGEVHWHGAAPDRTMTHIAIHEMDVNGKEVTWLEKVTDAEYSVPRATVVE